jgi:predicted 3-demethylubiquinone-9 3-methyltransferase (glyoxalase superfamily)
MQDLSTCLWFDHQAEEAVAFNCGLFPNSRILETKRYPQGAPRPAGSVLAMRFTLDGSEYAALSGGPTTVERSRPACARAVPPRAGPARSAIAGSVTPTHRAGD